MKKYFCQKCPWESNHCKRAFVCDLCGGLANVFHETPTANISISPISHHDPFTPEVLNKIMGDINNIEKLPKDLGIKDLVDMALDRPAGDITISERGRQEIDMALRGLVPCIGYCGVSSRPPVWGF